MLDSFNFRKKIMDVLSSSNLDFNEFRNLPEVIRVYIEYSIFLNIQQKTNKIQIDDIVVRKNSSSNSLETDKYGSVRRWCVVAVINEAIIGKRILLYGLGKPEMINSVHATERQVCLDPDYIDSIILGDRYYDPRREMAEIAKLKKQTYKHNKSISKKITAVDNATEFLSSLKVGDRFRTSDTFVGLSLSSYHNHWEVVDILNEEHTIIVVVSEVGIPYTSVDFSPNNLTGCIATSKEPFPLESIIKKQKTV